MGARRLSPIATLPEPRGPLSEWLIERLGDRPRRADAPPARELLDQDVLGGDDLQLALYVAYELHYRSFESVDERWEWEPSLLSLRRLLEDAFEAGLREPDGAHGEVAPEQVEQRLRALVDGDDGPSVGAVIARRPVLEQLRELVVQRSAFQLKEADAHTWAIPRLRGRAKAALVEIQADEYGSGDPARIHQEMYRDTMLALGLDPTYGAYLDHIPGVTLATVNVVSMFGLHRRLRGAAVGHLAAYEMGSPAGSRRYANALRRLGFGERATAFFDEHVVADSVHEAIATHDMAGGLAFSEPELAGDILFGARALALVERRFAQHVLGAWERGESSLRSPLGAAAPAQAVG